MQHKKQYTLTKVILTFSHNENNMLVLNDECIYFVMNNIKKIMKGVCWGIMLFLGLSLSTNLAFSQTNITIGGTTYYENNYTIPSFTELRRCNTSDQPALQNAIANLKDKEMPYNIVMNIYDDPTTKMAFSWFTNSNATSAGSVVEIVQGIAYDQNDFFFPLLTINATSAQVNNLNYNVSGNNLSSLANIANETQKSYISYKALAEGLYPNTTYSFRIGKSGFYGPSDVMKS